MRTELEAFVEEIKVEFPAASVDVEWYPSDVVMLNVRWREKLFILSNVGRRWGVDMVRDGEVFDTGLRIIAPDLGAARANLLRLMRAP